MIKVFREFINGQKGQALPIVLCLLAIGGLTVAGNINYATTGLNGGRISAEKSAASYAAEAGIEYNLWRLVHEQSPQVQLSDIPNQMDVTMQTQNTGVFTLYFGELIEPGEHFDYLTINGEITWDAGAAAYKYVIQVSLEEDTTVHLSEVGARLPPGFSYRAGSANSFPSNMSQDEPFQTVDSSGAAMLRWVFSNPLPELRNHNPTASQTFYITGSEVPEGEYAWVVANRTDIGVVGITGNRYSVTAEARRQGRLRARIRADVIITESEDEPYIVSWQILD